jgi:hypothetical protein
MTKGHAAEVERTYTEVVGEVFIMVIMGPAVQRHARVHDESGPMACPRWGQKTHSVKASGMV